VLLQDRKSVGAKHCLISAYFKIWNQVVWLALEKMYGFCVTEHSW